MHFSRRVPSDLAPNRFALALASARASGTPLLDLTVSNPTLVDLEYPPDLLAPLASPASLVYEPHPFGLPAAREAVAADFARRGVRVPADRVVLTASTSEAYSILFKLLCEPGDRVLVPRPSYPLFEHLTRLDGVEADSYLLEYHGRWSVDLESLARSISAGTRAVLAVSPNNPTGSFVDARDLRAMTALCREQGLALIGDEVFADYHFLNGGDPCTPPSSSLAGAPTPRSASSRLNGGDPCTPPSSSLAGGVPSAAAALGCLGAPTPRSASSRLNGGDPLGLPKPHPTHGEGGCTPPAPSVLSAEEVLTFSLGGLSKSAGLPQLKLGWIGVAGPDDLVTAALARLEVICDSYLSVGTPIQQAAGALIATGAAIRAGIAARITRNYASLLALVTRYPSCAVLPAEGGWYAVIQVPATRSEEDLVVTLLERDGVVVYPGYFFDFSREAFLVISLLPAPAAFDAASTRVFERASLPTHVD